MSSKDCCIIIPFWNRTKMLRENLEVLLADLPENVKVLLVDDGSTIPADENPELIEFIDDSRIQIFRHSAKRGPGAARNTGLAWCRKEECRLVILLDSDCVIEPGFTSSHISLHQRHPDVACIGGGILGQGCGFLARLDGIMSWFTSVPGSPIHQVTEPFHIPTTNMSFKLNRLQAFEEIFDSRLKTGEDVAFIKRLRAHSERILFSPEPEVRHNDRETLGEFFRHHFRWAIHSYAVRFGYDRPRLLFRTLLATSFILVLPVYAFYASFLNMWPLIKGNWHTAIYWPAVFTVYTFKGFGILAGILVPSLALYDRTGDI